eukprot:5771203-Prymnesium_polylepis.1
MGCGELRPPPALAARALARQRSRAVDGRPAWRRYARLVALPVRSGNWGTSVCARMRVSANM